MRNGIIMDNDSAAEQRKQNKKLDVFLGTWHTTGDIFEGDRIAGKVDAIDVYEWQSGEYAMIHRIESKMHEMKVHGLEIIGYDSSRNAYFAAFFDNQGSVGSELIKFENNTWIWNGENVMGVRYHRCIARFENKNIIK